MEEVGSPADNGFVDFPGSPLALDFEVGVCAVFEQHLIMLVSQGYHGYGRWLSEGCELWDLSIRGRESIRDGEVDG
jgi:hypothetical protein